jgi:hypothetical protein
MAHTKLRQVSHIDEAVVGEMVREAVRLTADEGDPAVQAFLVH